MSTLEIFPESADARSVFDLRKSNPSEAYDLAAELIKQKPDDIWIKRAYAWTLYDQIKIFLKNKNHEKANELFILFKNLEIPDVEEEKLLYEKFGQLHRKIESEENNPPPDETITHETARLDTLLTRKENKSIADSDKLSWSLYRYLKAANDLKKYDAVFINRILKAYEMLPADKPSRVHSLIYYQITQLFKNEVKGLDIESITNSWNPPDDLTEEDFKESSHEGKRVMPYSEKFIYNHIKLLLQLNNKEKIKSYLSKIDTIIHNHPKYSWLPYHKCKLLVAASSTKEEILKAIIPFVRKKSNEFWTWSSLGDALISEPEKAISCYCKALTNKGTDNFLVKVRMNLAKLLVSKKLYKEAKYEIQKITDVKNREKQRIPTEINNWIKEKWFEDTLLPQNNSAFYVQNLKIAEDIVFGKEVKSCIGVIINVDKVSGKAYFSVSKSIAGGFKPKKMQLKTGDVLEFKLNEKNEGGQLVYEVLSAEKSNKIPSKEIYREFEGTLRISKGGEIGFIDSVFVSKSMIESNGLKNNNLVKGIAIYSLNKKRNEFGWKAIKVWKE